MGVKAPYQSGTFVSPSAKLLLSCEKEWLTNFLALCVRNDVYVKLFPCALRVSHHEGQLLVTRLPMSQPLVHANFQIAISEHGQSGTNSEPKACGYFSYAYVEGYLVSCDEAIQV